MQDSGLRQPLLHIFRFLGMRLRTLVRLRLTATDALDAEGGHSQDGFDTVRLARRHNNANILSIGARFVSPEDADAAVRIFLSTLFDTDSPRHLRRLAKF